MVWIFWPSAHFRRMQTQRLGDGRGGGTLRTGVPEPQLRWQGGGRVDGEGLPPHLPGGKAPEAFFWGREASPLFWATGMLHFLRAKPRKGRRCFPSAPGSREIGVFSKPLPWV